MVLKPIDIIIPTLNRRKYLEIILKQLRMITHYPYRIIVVMNLCNDDTADFLYANKNLYDILIPLQSIYSLGECLNLALDKVESEDLIVTNDDMLIYNDGWLNDLYHIYKNGGWFAIRPFAVPFPKIDNRPNYAPEDLIMERSYAMNSYYRICNTEKIRKVGGFKWEANIEPSGRRGKDREGWGFSRIIKLYHGGVGKYLKIRMMDMSRIHRQPWSIQNQCFQHFIKTGEVYFDNIGSNKSMVVYSRRS